MKIITLVFLISAVFLPLFNVEAQKTQDSGVLFLENSLIKAGFIPELTGRIVHLELKSSPGNLIAPVNFVQIPLLKEMTVVCSNSNGGRVMNWEQGAFRANIDFSVTGGDNKLTLSGRAGEFTYSREFYLPPDSLVMYEKVTVRNEGMDDQLVSIWHQNCGLFSVPSPAKFKNLAWFVPAAKVRKVEKHGRKSPARRGVDFPGVVEYALCRESLGNNISVNPESGFMALTDQKNQISAIFVMDKNEIDNDGFFNGWFGKLKETHLASIEMISDEKLLPPGKDAVWLIRHILIKGLSSINGTGEKLVVSTVSSSGGMLVKAVAINDIASGRVELSCSNSTKKEFRIGVLKPGEIFTVNCGDWDLQPGERLFLRLISAEGKISDEFEIFWYKHQKFSSWR